MTEPIRYLETTDGSLSAGDPRDTLALRYDPSRRITLRFRLELADPRDLEALRYARRAMIREERTRGLEWDEPSMEDPTFTPSEIRWFVLAAQADWCRRKIQDLIKRANRAREELENLSGSQ